MPRKASSPVNKAVVQRQDRAVLAYLRALERDGGPTGDLAEAFVDVAGAYSRRRGIGYAAWREVGVPANILRTAGVPRTRRPALHHPGPEYG